MCYDRVTRAYSLIYWSYSFLNDLERVTSLKYVPTDGQFGLTIVRNLAFLYSL